MDNVNRSAGVRAALIAALSGARSACGAAIGRARRSIPVPSVAVTRPGRAALRRVGLFLPGILVLFTLAAIVTALEREPGPATRLMPLTDPSQIARRFRPLPPGWWQGRPQQPTPRVIRPGEAVTSLKPRVWLSTVLGLPVRELGAPLSAYLLSTVRLQWLCVGWVLAALALLPGLVALLWARREEPIGERLPVSLSPRLPVSPSPWPCWRAAVATFCPAGLVLLGATVAALVDGAPWGVALPPVVQAGAQVGLAAAVVVGVRARARSSGAAVVMGHALSLVGCLALPLVAAVALRWLTGWAAVLPDPALPAWVTGCARPALWLLLAGTAALGCLRRVTVQSADCGVRSAGTARFVRNPQSALRNPQSRGAWIAAGFAAMGLLMAARLLLGGWPGQASTRGARWGERFFALRLTGQTVSAPPELRAAFRAFAGGHYEEALEALRRPDDDHVINDDRWLLRAACRLGLGDLSGARAAAGRVCGQYAAGWALRAAADLRRLDPSQEAARLQPVLAALDRSNYAIYSPRLSAYLLAPYQRFPRPGQVALQIALLRRLIELRPEDDASMLRLAHVLVAHERMVTETPLSRRRSPVFRELMEQREKLLRQAIAANPRNTEALVLLGRLDEAIAIRPDDVRLRRLRLRHALETGDDRWLIDDARRLFALTGEAEAHYTLALAQVRGGDLPGGIRELDALLATYRPGPAASGATERERRGDAETQRRDGSVPASPRLRVSASLLQAGVADYASWAVSDAMLKCRLGQFREAESVLERALERGASGGTPMDPAVLLSLLKLAAGDRQGALGALQLAPATAPWPLLPSLVEITARGKWDRETDRQLNGVLEFSGMNARFMEWSAGGVRFDLEPVARALLRQDPHSLVGRYVLADALTARVPSRPPFLIRGARPVPPDAAARKALDLLHGLTREHPTWLAPYERVSVLASRLGRFDVATAYQRLIGDLAADQHPERWRFRTGFSGPRPGGQLFPR